ncbi:MAG TPA: hypothetical protein VD761_05105 [Solirubrobacterales bacterium]|nr:hypothetical protein [Solirubrobacterales bacterium]
MTVMAAREKWTDERLDDLNKKVDELKTEMREGFARVDTEIRDLRSDMNARFNAIDARFESLNRNLLAGMMAIIVALIGSNAF